MFIPIRDDDIQQPTAPFGAAGPLHYLAVITANLVIPAFSIEAIALATSP